MTMSLRALLVASALAAVMAAFAASTLAARPLASIRERGSILLCANPNALPYAAKDGERHGVEVELARALADQLGVGLEIGWVIFPFHIPRVDCDIILDSIVDQEVQSERHVRLSRPYQSSGVALAFRPGLEPVASYGELKPGLRIGAMVGSLARDFLGRRQVSTIPYTFEDEMIEAVGSGALDAAVISPASIGYYNLMHPNGKVAMTPAFKSVPELNWSVAVGMRKADDALVEGVNKALDKLIADGTLQRIYSSYGAEAHIPSP
jgi:ABC-type amino acid transport substrate-binding protein